MNPIEDRIWKFKGEWNGVDSQCDIKVYSGCGAQKGMFVIICSEIDNPGVSVTNAAEQIATEVCHTFNYSPNQIVWIEHYPAEGRAFKESFDRVFFNVVQDDRHRVRVWRLRSPKWIHLSKETVDEWLGNEPRCSRCGKRDCSFGNS